MRDNFSVHKWGNGERLLLAACVGLSFPDIAAIEQWPLRGQKETSRTYCKHSRHLSVCGRYRKRSSAKSSAALSPSHQVNSYRLWRMGWEQREYHESALNRRSNKSRLCQAKANCACRYGMWLFGFIHSSCQSRIFLSFFPSLPTWNCRKSAETLHHRTFKLQHTLLETVYLVIVPRNFWHWCVSDIDHRQIGACCACSKCGTFLFAPLMVIVLWPQASAILVSQFEFYGPR